MNWCQRSCQCPICWQPISLKDFTSQELLDGVVQERDLRLNPPRNAAIFHHPALGNFEIQHLPVGVNDAELEDRIIQHLAAVAAAMGRARHFARREGHGGRSSTEGHPQYLLFSANPNSQGSHVSVPEGGQTELTPASSVVTPSLLINGEEASPHLSSPNHSTQADIVSASGSSVITTAGHASPSDSGGLPVNLLHEIKIELVHMISKRSQKLGSFSLTQYLQGTRSLYPRAREDGRRDHFPATLLCLILVLKLGEK